MPKTALITGIAGQDGTYLANFLLGKRYRIVGITRSKKLKELYRLAFFGIISQITLVEGDICDKEFMREIIKKYKPNEFYNLAGQSSVFKSWEDPMNTFHTNSYAAVMILEFLREYSPKTRFFQCSSAEIYGNTSKIITESYRRFEPVNPYGISKLSAHLAVENFRSQYGIFAVNGILFNHESPLRSEFMVTKKIAISVARIFCGLDKQLSLGDINISRDWGYAGEFVEAMWLMLQQSIPRDFVICSGISLPIVEFVKEAFKYVNLHNWRQYVVTDKKLLRKMDIKKMIGSPRKINRELGWKQKARLKDIVKMMMDYELGRFSKKD